MTTKPANAAMQPWMQEYAAQLKRTAGMNCRFAACGGGWYALYIDNETATKRPRVRRSQILEMTAELATRPDFKPSAKA